MVLRGSWSITNTSNSIASIMRQHKLDLHRYPYKLKRRKKPEAHKNVSRIRKGTHTKMYAESRMTLVVITWKKQKQAGKWTNVFTETIILQKVRAEWSVCRNVYVLKHPAPKRLRDEIPCIETSTHRPFEDTWDYGGQQLRKREQHTVSNSANTCLGADRYIREMVKWLTNGKRSHTKDDLAST